jgi:predicted RecB family endonuclease
MSAKSEAQVFTEIETRLTAKFADLPAARVATVIDGARQQFADSTVRDFVPLLVERRAEEELARLLADNSTR